jgi:hypothetical protein
LLSPLAGALQSLVCAVTQAPADLKIVLRSVELGVLELIFVHAAKSVLGTTFVVAAPMSEQLRMQSSTSM